MGVFLSCQERVKLWREFRIIMRSWFAGLCGCGITTSLSTLGTRHVRNQSS